MIRLNLLSVSEKKTRHRISETTKKTPLNTHFVTDVV